MLCVLEEKPEMGANLPTGASYETAPKCHRTRQRPRLLDPPKTSAPNEQKGLYYCKYSAAQPPEIQISR